MYKRSYTYLTLIENFIDFDQNLYTIKFAILLEDKIK